jgi:asparagine synthase (glutamine-hydrolysing)
MCGIVGVARLNGGEVEPRDLKRMGDAIGHRGPDDEGSYTSNGVGLFHKRLSIIDLASGHQPMTAGDATIVFNGEIYNYVELRDELRAKGHVFTTTSDTEVILQAYLEWGEGCVARLNGMFAFVLHDRAQSRLLVARDHFGIKPLYVLRRGDVLLFASEVKALLQYPGVTAEADHDGIRDYLTFQFVLGATTLFKGVEKIQPGHYRVIELPGGRARDVKYWEPKFQIDPYHTEEYFVVELQRLLNDAVRLQMRADVPVGAYLSGGMDSSLVSILASRMYGGAFRTFTGSFREGAEFDESHHAREAARFCAAEMVEVVPTEDQFVDLLPTMIWHMDEPVAGPGLFPQYMVAREASRHVKVCLGGQGGDEIFGGYARYLVAYLEQALKGAIFETNDEREHLVSLSSIVPNLAALKQYAPMLQQFMGQGMFESMDRRYFRLIDRSAGAAALLAPDYRAEHDAEAVFGRFAQIFNHPDTRSYYNKMTHFDLVTGLPALLHVEDRVSMASSLESRVPLLDHRIADLVTSMPPAMKFKGGELKYILRKAAGHLLPRQILDRKDKMGFPVPLHLWMKGRSREFFHDILLSERCQSRGIFEPAEVRKLLANEQAFGRRLWGLLNLELWHRQFIDADSRIPGYQPVGPRAGHLPRARDVAVAGA